MTQRKPALIDTSPSARMQSYLLRSGSHDPLLRYQSANELLGALNSVKTQADARYREGHGFGLVRNGSIGALLILSAAAGVVKFNTYQQPAHPAAVVFAIPAPNLSQLHRTSTPIAVPKKDRAVALARKVSQATTEVEVKQAAEPQQLANAIVETTPPQPERKNRRIWSKLNSINPFRKRKTASKPTTDVLAHPH